MATGTIPVTLTFTYINPTQLILENPAVRDCEVPFVDHFQPLRASEIAIGTSMRGYGWCKRKGIAEAGFGLENLATVDIEFHGSVGIRTYVDIATAPLFILHDLFHDVAAFCTGLTDLHHQVNGLGGETDFL